ncbi:MAG: response regulator [Pseudomonadales bacterium]
MKLSEVSPALQLRCRKAVPGAQFDEVFSVHRPQGVKGFAELKGNLDSLILLISADQDFALRGQIICDASSDDYLMFVGSPWLSWITEHNPEANLGLSEFPRHDPQMDAAFYEATQKAMFKDLEAVNAQLRQAKEGAEKARSIQSDFFAVMSHEMRTPLNGIITALTLNRDTTSEREQQDLLNVAYTSANNLMTVINYVLDFSKLESGILEPEEEEFDLHETVNSIGDILHAKARAKDLPLNIRIDPDVPRWVRGDGTKIRQILINLVSNAVKFTDEGFVNINVTSAYLDAEREQFIFIVEDSGQGIAREDEARIFDAFWSSADKSGMGDANTGLGLNICKRITELLGGKLTYSSVQGEGSRFVLDLELDRIGEPPADTEETNLAQLFRGNVLLVDDNQANLFVGSLMLERMGLNVRTASDGAEAVSLVSTSDFDLILMDITMPVMDGETASREIRASGYDVPIIALTAHVGDHLLAQYQAAGMQELVHKPINKAELIRCMSRYLVARSGELEASTELAEMDTLVDEKVLAALIDNIGKANFAAANALFEKEMDSRVHAINAAWVDRDLATLAKEAHTLKSSAASFGAADFSGHMANLEEASRGNDIPALIELMPQLSARLKQTMEAYERQVARLSQ